MTDLHCQVRGRGRAIFFLHGFGNDHRVLLPLDDLFDESGGWRRFYLDLPGMGASPAGPEIDGSEAVVRAVREFVLDQAGDQAFALVGYSWGGLLARRLAFDLQERASGLALICPVAGAGRDGRRVEERRPVQDRPAFMNTLTPLALAEFENSGLDFTVEAWETFTSHVLPGLLAYDRSAIDRISARYELDSSPEQGLYRKPALICLGGGDHVVGFRDQLRLARHYPNATVTLLNGAGHLAHLERPAVVRALLLDWLDRMSRS